MITISIYKRLQTISFTESPMVNQKLKITQNTVPFRFSGMLLANPDNDRPTKGVTNIHTFANAERQQFTHYAYFLNVTNNIVCT